MRRIVLAAMIGCHSAPSAVLPAWTVVEDFGVSPASRPVGEPVVVQPHILAPGSTGTQEITVTDLLVIRFADGGKHQRNEQHVKLAWKVLAVDEDDHVSKLVVTVADATTAVDVDGNADHEALLRGAYLVTYVEGVVKALHADGTPVDVRETETLENAVGDLLVRDRLTRLLMAHPLRAGEAVALKSHEVHDVMNRDPMPGTYTLSLRELATRSATYRIDGRATGPGIFGEGTAEQQVRFTFTFDLARGRVIEAEVVRHKLEQSKKRTSETHSHEKWTTAITH